MMNLTKECNTNVYTSYTVVCSTGIDSNDSIVQRPSAGVYTFGLLINPCSPHSHFHCPHGNNCERVPNFFCLLGRAGGLRCVVRLYFIEVVLCSYFLVMELTGGLQCVRAYGFVGRQ